MVSFTAATRFHINNDTTLMQLSDYTPLTKEVPVRGGSLTVRGLSLDDVSILMADHLDDLESLFDLYDRKGDDPITSTRFILTLTRQAPALVATAIALACDAPDQVAKARKMSIPVQTNALQAILHLTFEEAGGFRKFAESLTTLIQSLRPATTQTDSPT